MSCIQHYFHTMMTCVVIFSISMMYRQGFTHSVTIKTYCTVPSDTEENGSICLPLDFQNGKLPFHQRKQTSSCLVLSGTVGKRGAL